MGGSGSSRREPCVEHGVRRRSKRSWLEWISCARSRLSGIGRGVLFDTERAQRIVMSLDKVQALGRALLGSFGRCASRTHRSCTAVDLGEADSMMAGCQTHDTNSSSDEHNCCKDQKRKYDHMSYGIIAVILMIDR